MRACERRLESSRSKEQQLSASQFSSTCHGILSWRTRYRMRWIKAPWTRETRRVELPRKYRSNGERCSSTTPARLHRSVLFMRFNVSTARTDGAFRGHQAGTYTRMAMYFHFRRETGFTRHVHSDVSIDYFYYCVRLIRTYSVLLHSHISQNYKLKRLYSAISRRDLNNTHNLSRGLNFKFKKYRRLENKMLAHDLEEFEISLI